MTAIESIPDEKHSTSYQVLQLVPSSCGATQPKTACSKNKNAWLSSECSALWCSILFTTVLPIVFQKYALSQKYVHLFLERGYGIKLALFPGLRRLISSCIYNNTQERMTSKKTEVWEHHHVNDVRWTWGGREVDARWMRGGHKGGGADIQICNLKATFLPVMTNSCNHAKVWSPKLW